MKENDKNLMDVYYTFLIPLKKIMQCTFFTHEKVIKQSKQKLLVCNKRKPHHILSLDFSNFFILLNALQNITIYNNV